LLKVLVFDASVSFNFYATLLAQAKITIMENNATGIFSTWPLFVYQALAQLDVAGDAQLVKILQWITLAATLVIGSLEAMVATDIQRAAGLMAEVYMLLSHMASDIEATRIGSNQHLSALADRRGVGLSTINPHLQATVLESQRQAVLNNTLLSRASASLGGSGRFFLPGGSDGAAALSATPSPYSTLTAVAPYDPALFSVLALPQSQLPTQPITQSTTTSVSTPAPSAAPSTTHTNDQPNSGNRGSFSQGGRSNWGRSSSNRNNGDRNTTNNRGGNKWYNNYKNTRDKRENNSNRDSYNNRDNNNNNDRRDHNYHNNKNNNYKGGRGGHH
jgi:hypothetical protein